MIIKFAKPALSLSCFAFLAACGGVPASNELQFDDDGNGRFSGSAGSGWAAEEIRSHAADHFCGNAPVVDFSVRVLPSAPDYKIFSGSCGAAADGFAVAGAGQSYTVAAQPAAAGPVVTPAANSSGWDGSTPFVD